MTDDVDPEDPRPAGHYPRFDDREQVLVRLTPRALHELYIEIKDLSANQRMAGHSAECDLCGEQVDLDRAIPNGQGEPCHRCCWADAYGAPDWFTSVG